MLIGPSLQIDPEQATPMKMGAAKLLGSIVPWLPLGHLDMKDLSRDLEAVKKQGPNSQVSFVLEKILKQASTTLHRIASRWPQDFVGLAFVYICLLAPQVTISQLLTNSPQNLRPTGRNTVYRGALFDALQVP